MYAQNLKKLRKHLNLSIAGLSEKLNIPARSLSAYERKERTPSIDLVIQLREKLDVDINWFITGVGDMFKTQINDTLPFTKDEIIKLRNLVKS